MTHSVGNDNAPVRKATMPLLWGGLAFFLILISQRQAEMDLFGAWQTEEYSHGFIIPFVALLIAWHRLVESKPVIRPSWLGVGCLVVAGFFQSVSALSAFDAAAEYSLIIALTGISLSFLGRQATWAIAPALFYLVFTIPLPHLVQANLSEDLQLLSSTLGVWPLDFFGIPVFQEGNVIDLGGFKLQVVEACSGLRYLFPLMSFGYLLAFLLKDRMWKRIVIFVSTIPITIGMNALRIAFIGFTVDMWGPGMAEGFIHSFEGWTVFLACITILMAEIWVLVRIGTHGHFRYEYLGPAHGELFGGDVDAPMPRRASFIMVIVLAGIFGTGQLEQRSEILPARPPMSSFGLALGDWLGRQVSLTPEILQALQLSDYWNADYKRPDSPIPVNLYIAYYASQRVGTTTHSPSNCIPGGGWQIDNSRVETVTLADGTKLQFTRLLIRNGDNASLVYYWFDERGRDLTETYSAKWYLLWDSITMHRTDGALVRLITSFGHNETEASAEKRLNDFLNTSYPEIRAFIPGKTAINSVAAPP